MTPELLDRVDSWLSVATATDPAWQRQASLSKSSRWLLAGEWRLLAADLRAWPGDPGALAKACGVLLAIVREAWRDRTISVGTMGRWDPTAQVVVPIDRWDIAFNEALANYPIALAMQDFSTEEDALVAALEAVPL